jgi:hypothetical protein
MGAWFRVGAASAVCVTLALPDGPPLDRVLIDDYDPVFRVTYIHSVTRTPVDEIYRVERNHHRNRNSGLSSTDRDSPTAPG